MDLITTKIVTMVILGVVSLILGFIPLKIGRFFVDDRDKPWKRTVTSILLCFGGGVLFATGFIHMLPEVREGLESSGLDIDGRPVAEILLCCGFFFIYLIEECVHFFLDKSVHHHHDDTIQVHRSFSIHSAACEAGMAEVDDCNTPRRGSVVNDVPSGTRRQRATSYPAVGNHHVHNDTEVAVAARIPKSGPASGPNYRTFSSSDTSTSASSDDFAVKTLSSMRDFLTVLALSFHAVFEGLAIGLEKETSDVWTLFAAVATHKYVISFCVGLELFQAGTRLSVYTAYMLLFVLISPLGIGLGLIITSAATEGIGYTVAVAVLQALAGGTIIYVVVFEVLQRERSKSVSGLVQLVFVILGFSVMMFIELFAGHSHGHSHD